jgi:hypothetical protein
MPINEALFWVGLTMFGTGIYFLRDKGLKDFWSLAMTIIGSMAVIYSVYRHYHPDLPSVPIWVSLLIITWIGIAYDVFDRHRQLSTPKQNPDEIPLVIHSADWGTGLPGARDLPRTEILRKRVKERRILEATNPFLEVTPINDPAFKDPKRLLIVYSYGDSKVVEIERPEYEFFMLPEDPWLKKKVAELQAKYLEKCAAAEERDRLILVRNSEIGELKKDVARLGQTVTVAQPSTPPLSGGALIRRQHTQDQFLQLKISEKYALRMIHANRGQLTWQQITSVLENSGFSVEPENPVDVLMNKTDFVHQNSLSDPLFINPARIEDIDVILRDYPI